MIATQILAKVEAGRLQKAVEGLVNGVYTIILASQSDAEIRGFVANGDGKDYGVVLSESNAYCGCKDAIYRHGVCKHAVALALHAIRNPKTETTAVETIAKPTEQPVSLKLGKVRKGFAFSA
jgi:hypothetical protein